MEKWALSEGGWGSTCRDVSTRTFYIGANVMASPASLPTTKPRTCLAFAMNCLEYKQPEKQYTSTGFQLKSQPFAPNRAVRTCSPPWKTSQQLAQPEPQNAMLAQANIRRLLRVSGYAGWTCLPIVNRRWHTPCVITCEAIKIRPRPNSFVFVAGVFITGQCCYHTVR